MSARLERLHRCRHLLLKCTHEAVIGFNLGATRQRREPQASNIQALRLATIKAARQGTNELRSFYRRQLENKAWTSCLSDHVGRQRDRFVGPGAASKSGDQENQQHEQGDAG
jgi:hypothetical protein